MSAGMGCLSEHLENYEHTALAAAHDDVRRPAWFCIEDCSRCAGLRLDDWPRGWRGDLLVAGHERHHGCRVTAEACKRRNHEGIHDKARLHVGHSRTVGASVLDSEWPAASLAGGKDGITMAHQYDRSLVVGRRMRQGRPNGVTKGGVR